jgi:hypothetical protein
MTRPLPKLTHASTTVPSFPPQTRSIAESSFPAVTDHHLHLHPIALTQHHKCTRRAGSTALVAQSHVPNHVVALYYRSSRAFTNL